MNYLVDFYQRIITKHAFYLIGCLVIFLAVLAWKMPDFRMDASADSLVLESDRSLQYYRKIKQRYGSDDFLFITFSPETELFDRQQFSTIEHLAKELEQLSAVTSVTHLLNVPLLNADGIDLYNMADKLTYLSDENVDLQAAKQHILQNPLYYDMLLSQDAKTTAMQVNLAADSEYETLLAQVNELRRIKVENGLTPEQKQQLEDLTAKYRIAGKRVSDNQQQLVSDVRQIIEKYRDKGELFLGGIPMISSDIMQYIGSDLSVFGVAIVVFLIIMLAFLFRRRRWIVIPMLCCVATVVAMFGFLGWMDWPVTVISSNFVSLLLVLTMSMNIHLIVRFNEFMEQQPDMPLTDLVTNTVKAMAEPCFYTSLTTLVAFASLIISGIRPVIDFGLMMTFGIAVSFVLCFLIFPVAALMAKKPKRRPQSRSKFSGITQFFAHVTTKHGLLVLVMGGVLAIFSVSGMFRLQVDNRFIDYFKESTEIYQGMKKIDTELGGTTPFDVIIDFDGLQGLKTQSLQEVVKSESASQTENLVDEFSDVDDVELADEFSSDDETLDDEFSSGDSLVDEFGSDEEDDVFATKDKQKEKDPYWPSYVQFKQLAQVHNYLEQRPETGKVLSLHTTMAVSELVNKGQELDNFTLQVLPKLIPEEARDQLISPYYDEKDGQLRLSIRMIESNPDLKRQEFLQQLRQDLVHQFNVADDKLHFTGMLVLYNNMLQSLFQSQIMTLGAVFLAITFMFAVLFRSLYLAVLTIIPNLISAVFILGVMGWFGVPLDLMTITIAAITIGIAVDDSVHYVVRFKNEFPKIGNYKETVFKCHQTIGQAMYYTTLTIVVGFSILALSNFIPSIYFGLFTGLAMVIALVANLTLLPKLFMTFKPLGKEESTAVDVKAQVA